MAASLKPELVDQLHGLLAELKQQAEAVSVEPGTTDRQLDANWLSSTIDEFNLTMENLL